MFSTELRNLLFYIFNKLLISHFHVTGQQYNPGVTLTHF